MDNIFCYIGCNSQVECFDKCSLFYDWPLFKWREKELHCQKKMENSIKSFSASSTQKKRHFVFLIFFPIHY